ncbi:MAG TPA: hypothetical protein VFD82_24845 [Planctomycetota bacterium]|nr:hypothetical protein [Planctomycetota bacterium]
MNLSPLAVSLGVAVLLALPASAQGGGGGGGRGRQRPEEIINRVGVFFTDVSGPAADGDKVADLATTELVRAAAGAEQLSVLYLHNGNDEKDVREQFERMLFAGDELGIELRCFHCGRIDLAKEPALKTKYGDQAPLFVAFDKKGQAGEIVSMNGYKVAANALSKQLEKAAQGVLKPALATFAKDYAGFVRDLEQALNKKKLARERYAKAGSDKIKRAEIEKDLKLAESEEEKILAREKEMLEKMRLPERPATAQRLGGGRGGWGG